MKYEDIPEIIRDKMHIDELIFGNAFCLKKEDGTFERISPEKVILNITTGKFEIQPELKCELCGKECKVEHWKSGRIKAISCPEHQGKHDSGDYSYLCGSDYCRCCN
jgi:hypothetical protein